MRITSIRFIPTWFDCSFQPEYHQQPGEHENNRGTTSTIQDRVVKQVAEAHSLYRGYVLVPHTYVILISVN